MSDYSLNRRKFLHAAAAVTGGLLAAACAPATAPQAEGGAAAPVEVNWYVRTTPAETQWRTDKVIPTVEEQNPNIKINLIVTPQPEAMAKLLAMHAAGNTPDVWANDFGAGYTAGLGLGMVQPLSDFIESSSLIDMDEYSPAVIDLFTHAGKVWALPYMICGSFIYYNKDLLDEAGLDYPSVDWDDQSWTWDSMVDLASKATKNYGEGADAQYGLQLWTSAGWYLFQWLWGADPFTPEEYVSGYPCQISLTSEEAIAGMQAGVDLIYEHRVAPPPAELDSLTAGGNPFLTGRVVMNMTGGWGFWGDREFTGFRWGAAALPWQVANSDPLWPNANMLSRSSANPDAAWKLVEYINSEDGMRGYVQATNAQPAANSLWEDWYALFEDKIPREELQAGMEGSIKYGKIPYSHTMADTNQIITVMGQQLDPLWLGEKGVEETLIAAEAELQKVLDEKCGQSLEQAAQDLLQNL